MSFFVKVRAARRGAYLAFIGLELTKGRKQLKVVRPLKCVMHDQCDDKPTVTFPAAERHRPFAGTKIYCLVTVAQWCEQYPVHTIQPVVKPVKQSVEQPATSCKQTLNRMFNRLFNRFDCNVSRKSKNIKNQQLECGPMPNVMVALPNIGDALCSTPQSLADAHCWSTVQ